MDTTVLLACVAIASASAVVLRMAWRGRARANPAPVVIPAKMVAKPLDTSGSSFDWMRRLDPNVANAFLELGQALSQSAAPTEPASLGSKRIFDPTIARGTDLRQAIAVRPPRDPDVVLAPARQAPDPLRTFLEALKGDVSAKWDAQIEALTGVR